MRIFCSIFASFVMVHNQYRHDSGDGGGGIIIYDCAAFFLQRFPYIYFSSYSLPMSIEHMVFTATHIKTNNNKKKWKIIFHIFPSFTQRLQQQQQQQRHEEDKIWFYLFPLPRPFSSILLTALLFLMACQKKIIRNSKKRQPILNTF